MSQRYQLFRSNPFIDTIAGKKKWTVSTNTKMPIDMNNLIYKGKLTGALYNDDLSLVSLDKVNETLPDAANYAFYLDALEDGFVVLDIEPKCPDDVRAELMAMPCLYCETSLSGHGIHMVFRLPSDILDAKENARQKIVFKEDHGWYEILLNHYVTFTGNQIAANIGDDDSEFRNLFARMASEQKASSKADVDVFEIEEVKTRYANAILEVLMSHRNDYRKTLADFSGDTSRYEFSYIAFLNHRLGKMLKLRDIAAEHEYTDAERAWFLYKVASEYLPSRSKHENRRNGLPWLLYLSSEVIAHNKESEASGGKKKGG